VKTKTKTKGRQRVMGDGDGDEDGIQRFGIFAPRSQHASLSDE
jgi:hypothetical protein